MLIFFLVWNFLLIFSFYRFIERLTVPTLLLLFYTSALIEFTPS